MSTDTDVRTARDERPPRAQAEAPPEADTSSPAFDRRTPLMMVLGGLLTGGLLVAILTAGARSSADDYQLQPIAKDEITAASQSLVSAQAAALVEQAKTCRAPLASLVVQATGSLKGSIRFRSGPYVSPNLLLGPRADRVALPYPAPYATGHGQIAVENNTDGADVFLSPGVHVGTGQRSRVINVRWNPDAPC